MKTSILRRSIILVRHTYVVILNYVTRSNATYHRIYDAYNNSRAKLEDAEEAFEEGCLKYEDEDVALASLRFIGGIGA